jgi:hypothetical protein
MKQKLNELIVKFMVKKKDWLRGFLGRKRDDNDNNFNHPFAVL